VAKSFHHICRYGKRRKFEDARKILGRSKKDFNVKKKKHESDDNRWPHPRREGLGTDIRNEKSYTCTKNVRSFGA